MRTATYLLIAATFGLAACKPADHRAAKVDTAAEEQAIRAKEAGWMDAYNKHDAAGLLSQFEDGASSANAGMALITDATARKAFLDGVAADPALKVDFASDRIIVAQSGELASSRGHYSFTFTDPETKQPKTETGNYLTVYRKAADGSWKAVEDFVTPGAPAAPPAPPAG
jgi:ketosteroid isomerase-like protein